MSMDSASRGKEPCASCEWMTRLLPFGLAAFTAFNFFRIPRGDSHRLTVALLGTCLIGIGIRVNLRMNDDSRKRS
jgi:hypothetical protein